MKNIAVVLFVTILFAACKKDEKLPTPTHSGANTFACKIDGKVFSVSGVIDGAITDGLFLGGGGGIYLKVLATHGYTDISIGFPFPINQLPRVSVLSGADPILGRVSIYTDGTVPTPATLYETNGTNIGEVIITHFTSTYISGTFTFDARNGEGKVIHITDGQFDAAR